MALTAALGASTGGSRSWGCKTGCRGGREGEKGSRVLQLPPREHAAQLCLVLYCRRAFQQFYKEYVEYTCPTEDIYLE